MILSKRMTAKRRDAKPTMQARDNTTKVSRLLEPATLSSIELAAGVAISAPG